MSIDGRMDKDVDIYTMGYYSAIKNNLILPFATTWVDLESIMLSEISQTEKDKLCYHLYVQSKKIKQMNQYDKTEIDSHI